MTSSAPDRSRRSLGAMLIASTAWLGLAGPAAPARACEPHAVARPAYAPLPLSVPGVREPVRSLDGSWRFTPLHDREAAPAPGAWVELPVPGEWAMSGFEVPEGQWAAYARSFEIPIDWLDVGPGERRVRLRFEGVFSVCTVVVNGREVGGHEGGFTAFELDVTDAIQPGANELLVRVQGASDVDKLASASQYAVHDLGGITRPVTLFVVPRLHVADLRTWTTLGEGQSLARLTIDLALAGGDDRTATSVTARLLADGATAGAAPRVVACGRIDAVAPGRATLVLVVPEPRLWDPEHPVLHELVVEVHDEDGGSLAEALRRRIGLRTVAVRERELLVNGRPIALRGVNRHEVHPLAGRVVDAALALRDATLFRDANVNYVRTSHYPPTRAFLTACDELGIVVECEAPICWMQHGANPNWQREGWSHLDRERWQSRMTGQNLECVAFNGEHPSVIIWSLANESAWSPLWAETLAAVEAADPTRPTTFHDQCWGGYNNHGSTAAIANMHYPGPGFADEVARQERPVLFGEYAHLNAYNRHELATDPGVRDAWGGLLHVMWERMHADPGVVGGAIWSGIDDEFRLPVGSGGSAAVGYGSWGPLDAFRRPKPEHWHMKKAYAPIRARCTEDGRLAIANRHDFTDLSEVEVRWAQGDRTGTLAMELPPRSVGTFAWPDAVEPAAAPIELAFVSPRGFEIDRVVLEPASGHARHDEDIPADLGPRLAVTAEREGPEIVVVCGDVSFRVDRSSGAFGGLFLGDRAVLAPGLHFMLIPLQGAGDTQMTPGMPEPEPFNPFCGGWALEQVAIKSSSDGSVSVEIVGRYAELEGAYELRLDPWGRFSVEYDMTMLTDVSPRQWGVSLEVPRAQEHLGWHRDAEWTTYPPDHIGRPEGRATPAGIVTPSGQWPEHPWSLDHSELGSNDFRSTRRRVRRVSLADTDGVGIELVSDGRHASRCWIDGDRIRWLVAAFDHPGAERFLRSHAAPHDAPLERGDRMRDAITLRVLDDSSSPGSMRP